MKTRMPKPSEYIISAAVVAIFFAALGVFGDFSSRVPPVAEFRQWEHVYHALSTKRKPMRGIVVQVHCPHPISIYDDQCGYRVRFADSHVNTRPPWYARRELFNRVEWTQYLANAIKVK